MKEAEAHLDRAVPCASLNCFLCVQRASLHSIHPFEVKPATARAHFGAMATDDVASLVTISQDPQPIIAQAGTVKAPVQTVSARPELQKYLILAKASRGAASAKLVEEATAAPGIFVFAELLQTAGVKDVRSDSLIAHVAAGRPLPIARRPARALLVRHLV